MSKRSSKDLYKQAKLNCEMISFLKKPTKLRLDRIDEIRALAYEIAEKELTVRKDEKRNLNDILTKNDELELYSAESPEKGKIGYIEYDDDIKKYKIVIREDLLERSNPLRFTLAHELGHYYLHSEKMKSGKYYPRNNFVPTDDVEDYEADQFAAELLMPYYDIEDRMLSGEYFSNIVDYVSNYYGVSKGAAYRRVNYIAEELSDKGVVNG